MENEIYILHNHEKTGLSITAKRNYLIRIITLLLTLLWAYAAISKWNEFRVFGEELRRQPLPAWSINLLHITLPFFEMTIALLICFQRTRLTGFLASSFMLFVFTLYVAFALVGVFQDVPCSCAGLISALRWKGHLIFNIIFTLISLIGFYLLKHKDDHFVKHKHTTT